MADQHVHNNSIESAAPTSRPSLSPDVKVDTASEVLLSRRPRRDADQELGSDQSHQRVQKPSRWLSVATRRQYHDQNRRPHQHHRCPIASRYSSSIRTKPVPSHAPQDAWHSRQGRRHPPADRVTRSRSDARRLRPLSFQTQPMDGLSNACKSSSCGGGQHSARRGAGR